jgi:hypothetical protein
MPQGLAGGFGVGKDSNDLAPTLDFLNMHLPATFNLPHPRLNFSRSFYAQTCVGFVAGFEQRTAKPPHVSLWNS